MIANFSQRASRDLKSELMQLQAAIQDNGLSVELNAKLASYQIDCLNFEDGMKRLSECRVAEPNNAMLSDAFLQANLLSEIHKLAKSYCSQKTRKKLISIGSLLANAVKFNIYPRLERDLEQELYNDILAEQTIMRIEDIGTLVANFSFSDSTLVSSIESVNRLVFSSLPIQQLTKELQMNIDIFSKHKNLLDLLRLHPVNTIYFENFLKNIRKLFLLSIDEYNFSSNDLQVLSSLAAQCFVNEYVFSVTLEERKVLASLRLKLEACKNIEAPENSAATLIYASYEPLYHLGNHASIERNTLLRETYEIQVKSTQREAFFEKQVPVKLNLTNDVSIKVQSQYEHSPYPRWISLQNPHKKQSPNEWLCGKLGRKVSDLFPSSSKVNILVAGTGTGQQAISAATVIKNSQIDAVDISKKSLSYAMKKTSEMNVKNIAYYQADLFELDFLNKKYDWIMCSGVLHHTYDPLKGLIRLGEKLKPNGVLQIALYSRLARQKLNVIREMIRKRNLVPNVENIRAIRNELFFNEAVTEEAKDILFWKDAFNSSGFRDLCFHYHEIQYDCMELQTLIDKAGMRFSGMLVEPKVLASCEMFRGKTFENLNLEDWHLFESENPETFKSMYSFLLKLK